MLGQHADRILAAFAGHLGIGAGLFGLRLLQLGGCHLVFKLGAGHLAHDCLLLLLGLLLLQGFLLLLGYFLFA